ncbi:hypothetical protein [Streptomyces sp. NPDC000880]
MTRASRFLIDLATCFATHGRIPAVARTAWRRVARLSPLKHKNLKGPLQLQRFRPARRAAALRDPDTVDLDDDGSEE